MTNAELIKALQCASHFALYQDCYEKNCYANSGKGLYCNIPKLMADAADALEAADKRIDGLQKLVDINTERCEALRKQLRDSHESYEKHINELEAQLPKEGEWIDLFGHDYKCSVCGEWYRMDGTPEQEDMNYYPNCGAKMDGADGERKDGEG